MNHVQAKTETFEREFSPRAVRNIPSTMRLVIIIVVALSVVLLGRSAGTYLVIDSPERADAIVVLAGDQNDRRYYRALQLLNERNGRLLFVDSSADLVAFGRTLASQEEEFIRRGAGSQADHVSVCPIRGDSTAGETSFVQDCLQGRGLKSVILVTSDFHTRRALSVFQRRLPQYHWSVAATEDQNRFGEKWWRQREWAKATVLEWFKFIWWETVDRWRNSQNPTGTQF
jgi:uncharacterized SAM-binding protein YcdF (DUF218 family)